MTRDINKWIYNGDDGIEANYRKGLNIWVETNESCYVDQLECVPPFVMKRNAFMVGEAYTHDKIRYIPVHAAFVEINGRYFGKLCKITEFNVENFEAQIRKQFEL